MPKNIRGRMICALASSWLFGNLLVILMAYIILNHSEFKYILFGGAIILNNWRVFMIFCSFPSLLTALLLLFLPESPKFHICNGMPEAGKNTLKSIYKINHRLKTELEIEAKRKAFEILDDLRDTETEKKMSDDDQQNQDFASRPQRQTSFMYMVQFFKSTTQEVTEIFFKIITFKLFKEITYLRYI